MGNSIIEEAKQIASQSQMAYLATARDGRPSVRPILPAWDSDALWIAATTGSPKMRDVQDNERVELFWHLTDDFHHLTIRGTAEVVTDAAEKKRMWDVFSIDLSEYYGDAGSEWYGLMKITPTRIECSSLDEIRNGASPRVWRA